MSIYELEKHTIKLSSEITDNEIVCRVDDYVTKRDRYDRDVIQLKLYCRGYGRVIVNYSPQKAKDLIIAFKNLAVDYIIGRCFVFERVFPKKMRDDYTTPYPTFIPIKVIECDSIRE